MFFILQTNDGLQLNENQEHTLKEALISALSAINSESTN